MNKVVGGAISKELCKVISAMFRMHFSEANLGLGFFRFAICAFEIYISEKSHAI